MTPRLDTRRIGITWRFAACLVVGLVALGSASRAVPIEAQESTAPRTADPISEHRETIKQDRETCHNTRLKTGGLILDTLDLGKIGRDAETWEQVVRRLRVGAMPPRGSASA